MPQDLYYNGTIITMEKPLPSVEAVLVEDGTIKAAGDMEGLLQIAEPGANRIDLMGHTMLPAFIDPHSHITALAQTMGLQSLAGTGSYEEIGSRLKSFQEKLGVREGQWIIGFGYDHNFLKEKKHPDKFMLDQYFPDIPVVLSHTSGHMGVANSQALKLMGVDENTPDPVGGRYGRVPGFKEPDGYMEETAFTMGTSKIPKPEREQLEKQYRMAEDIYFQYGITTIQDGITRKPDWKLLEDMAEKAKIRADVVSYVDLKLNPEILTDNSQYVSQYKNHLKIGGYKIFLDGSPQGRTAWMSKPYVSQEKGDEEYRGYPVYKDEEVTEFFMKAMEADVQLLVHCNGDQAAEQMIHCYEEAKKQWKAQGKEERNIHPVMIHAQLVREDQLARMKQLDIFPSFFLAHIYHWGDIHIKNFGMERAGKISPAKTAADNDMVFTLHQDSPVIMPDMLETVWCAVNRLTKSGVLLGEDERLTPQQALEGVTINAAIQYGEQERKGSIKPGKCADFVILDQNPVTVSPDKIKEIQVLETIMCGQSVYRKK